MSVPFCLGQDQGVANRNVWAGLNRLRELPWRSGASDTEVAARLPGDELVPDATVSIDRAVTLAATPAEVWPWLAQLGKHRAGWYLPRRVEAVLPRSRRALRHLDPAWQSVSVGEQVPDWGPGTPVLRAMTVDPPHAVAYLSLRDRNNGHRWPADGCGSTPNVLAISWTLVLTELGEGARLHIRLRMRVRRRSLAAVGGVFDWLTICGLFAGLKQRVTR